LHIASQGGVLIAGSVPADHNSRNLPRASLRAEDSAEKRRYCFEQDFQFSCIEVNSTASLRCAAIDHDFPVTHLSNIERDSNYHTPNSDV
jgi:hypothetical protein